jgi:4-alpha-glucanotransferase
MIGTKIHLRDLLRDCRIQSSYEDVTHRRRRASVDSLLVLLRSLGVPIDRPEQAGEILHERRRGRLGCGVEPVLVAWNGRLQPVAVTSPPRAAGEMTFSLQSELGELLAEGSASLEDLPAEIGPDVEIGGQTCESLVIAAPLKAFVRHDSETGKPMRNWAPFLPLYSLRTEHDWGAGDFRALSELAQWAGELGAGAVGTLPLLAARSSPVPTGRCRGNFGTSFTSTSKRFPNCSNASEPANWRSPRSFASRSIRSVIAMSSSTAGSCGSSDAHLA